MIYGERIRLRRNERSDIPKFVEWLNDPDEKLTIDEAIFCILYSYGFKKVKVLRIYYK